MPLIPLIILGLLFLVGAIALGIGHKGWSWGTIAAAWLVLLTSVGAFFLVGMLGQREREWRKVVAAYQAAIARERDALVPAGANLRPDPVAKPLATLEDERDRWARVRDRINTWRGRHWDNAEFAAPAGDRPGTISIAGLENTTINPGAELYVFDTTPIEQGGRFLGAYRVDAVDKNVFQVSNISVPDAADLKALAQPRDGKVVVYEDLPIDRSIAFHRTPVPATPEGSADGASIPAPSESLDGTAGPKKSDPEAMLRHLERKLEEFRLHDTVISGDGSDRSAAATDGLPGEAPTAEGDAAAEGDGALAANGDGALATNGDGAPGTSRPVADPTLSETPPLGVHWARVVFNKAFDYTWPDGTTSVFAEGETLPSIPAEQVAVLRERGADFTSTWSIPPGLYWANVEFKQAHSFPRAQGEAIEFEPGRTVQFDLDTAKTLEKDGIATITSVIFRRPLADANVALRGAGQHQADGRPLPLEVNGLVVMRRILEEDKRSIDSSIGQLRAAKASTEKEIALRQSEQSDLQDDIGHWRLDVDAAQRAAGAFESQLASIRRQLSDSEGAIGTLGREFNAAIDTLTRSIDQSAPAPSRPPVPADLTR
jgi:hypothetical protein